MRIGFCSGSFDGLDAGHRFFLTKAREQCSWLIIAIHTDAAVKALKGERGPVLPLESRIRDLYNAVLAPGAAIVPFDGDTVALIKVLKPDVLIRGYDQSDDGVEVVPAIVRLPQLKGISDHAS